jgi:hypothetical protein
VRHSSPPVANAGVEATSERIAANENLVMAATFERVLLNWNLHA